MRKARISFRAAVQRHSLALTPSSQNVFCLAGTGQRASRAKRPLRGPISLMPHRSVNQSGSWTVDRERCVLKTESDMGPRLLPPVKRTAPGSVKGIGAPVPISNRIFLRQRGMSSPPPGSCASSCLAVFPGPSIRRLSLTFKTGSVSPEQVIGASPIGVSIVRGLGRRDTASVFLCSSFLLLLQSAKSSAPGCAVRGAVIFYSSFNTATARSSSWGYRWA